MPKKKLLRGSERIHLVEELEHRYGRPPGVWNKFIYWRKKYSWLLVVQGAKFVKRVFDVVVSSLLLLFLSPVFLAIALMIKWQDRGPVFYVTNRVGKWGEEFRFPKFRSMHLHADQMKDALAAQNEEKDKIHFKMKNDPRVTPLGRVLRKTSLDELPQLWCVLKGEMSLVGPRPPLPQEVAKYNLEEMRRLEITPGITGIWQVSGRSDIPFKKQVKLDVEYIKSNSFWMDCKILLKTIPAVILGKGAY
jgi:exopolysaccharide biosynthesis polyprenyl glycosylphosphotransferase